MFRTVTNGRRWKWSILYSSLEAAERSPPGSVTNLRSRALVSIMPEEKPKAACAAAAHADYDTAEKKDGIRAQLNRVLESPAFRGSKRCQHFLRYVVEQTLDGHVDSLKERTLGVEIFDRQASYDTSEDAIVRVKANELRKRLAVYYVEAGHEQEVRIELPSGSYAPEFHWVGDGVGPVGAAPPRRLRRWLGVAALAALGLLVGAMAWVRFAPSASPADQFWAPVVQSPRPVLICSAHPVVYLLARRVHEKFKRLHPDLPPGPYIIKLPPNEITGDDVVPVVDQYIGVGDAQTAAQLSALFARMGKPSQTRIGSDISFTDLRNSSAILIGAFSNFWTLEMTKEFRFVFEIKDGVKMVRDRAAPDRKWALPNMAPDGKTPEDYTIVSRVFESGTGQLLISVAGITQYGTQSGGEFLANPAYLSEALRGAPAGWQSKNLQVLLHTKIIGRTPAAPRVLETHFW